MDGTFIEASWEKCGSNASSWREMSQNHKKQRCVCVSMCMSTCVTPVCRGGSYTKVAFMCPPRAATALVGARTLPWPGKTMEWSPGDPEGWSWKAFSKTCPQPLPNGELGPGDDASQVALVVKNPSVNAGDKRDTSSIPGSGRCPGERNGNLFQYSCLENPMDRGA